MRHLRGAPGRRRPLWYASHPVDDPPHLAGHGVHDALSTVLLGEHVPRVRLDLEVSAGRLATEPRQQLAQVPLRIEEPAQALAEERHVEVDSPLARLASRSAAARLKRWRSKNATVSATVSR